MNTGCFIIRIDSSTAGSRLDLLDLSAYTHLSRARFQALIHSGKVLLNDSQVRPSCRLKAGDVVSITVPEPEPAAVIPQDLPFSVLYEDSDIIVVDKPRGMVVHPGAGVRDKTLVNALIHHCGDLSGIGGVLRPGIVHRLDKGTSGVIIAAKNDHAHQSLAHQFSSRSLKKQYLALASGQSEWQEITVDQPIGRHPGNRIKMCVSSGGKSAVTRFIRISCGHQGFLTEAHPSSGRTHQIRVHLEYLKHPILGDPLYGTGIRRNQSIQLQKTLQLLNGFCLHAFRIVFCHPSSGQIMEVCAPVPNDFRAVMESLGLDTDTCRGVTNHDG